MMDVSNQGLASGSVSNFPLALQLLLGLLFLHSLFSVNGGWARYTMQSSL